VNIVDLFAMARQIGRRPPNLRYDLNGDGRLTGQDLIVVVRAIGRRCR
jgi:hypothetical protein